MDFILFNAIHDFAGKNFFLDETAVLFAVYLPYILIILAGVFVVKRALWKERIYAFLIIALSVTVARGIIAESIRFVYEHPRPFVELGFVPLIAVDATNSFPSGHASFLFALAVASWYFNRTVGYWFLGGALVNGIARVFTGVHWPFDILGGMFVALISYIAVWSLLQNYEFKKK